MTGVSSRRLQKTRFAYKATRHRAATPYTYDNGHSRIRIGSGNLIQLRFCRASCASISTIARSVAPRLSSTNRFAAPPIRAIRSGERNNSIHVTPASSGLSTCTAASADTNRCDISAKFSIDGPNTGIFPNAAGSSILCPPDSTSDPPTNTPSAIRYSEANSPMLSSSTTATPGGSSEISFFICAPEGGGTLNCERLMNFWCDLRCTGPRHRTAPVSWAPSPATRRDALLEARQTRSVPAVPRWPPRCRQQSTAAAACPQLLSQANPPLAWISATPGRTSDCRLPSRAPRARLIPAIAPRLVRSASRTPKHNSAHSRKMDGGKIQPAPATSYIAQNSDPKFGRLQTRPARRRGPLRAKSSARSPSPARSQFRASPPPKPASRRTPNPAENR